MHESISWRRRAASRRNVTCHLHYFFDLRLLPRLDIESSLGVDPGDEPLVVEM